MDPKLVDILTFWSPNILSIIACIALFVCYCRLPKKTQSLTMILTLAASNFIYHFIVLLLRQFPSVVIIEYVVYIAPTMFRFSLLWACNMAFFLYKLLTLKGMSNIKLYFYVPLVLCLVASIASTMIT